MPYIKQGNRKALEEKYGAQMLDYIPTNPGELNFVLTLIIRDYLRGRGVLSSYQDYNDVIGALEACKLELYRRKIVPYEEGKIDENGDVW